MGSQRESGRLCRAAACIAALAAALLLCAAPAGARDRLAPRDLEAAFDQLDALGGFFGAFAARETNAFAQERWWRLSRGYPGTARSEEHTSELQSLMRISYAVFCLKKKNTKSNRT